MTKKSPHYHKYERMNWDNGKIYYKCMEPGCPHYIPHANLAIGRESLCWGINCNKLVIITKEDIARQALHPMCSDCKRLRALRREELRNI
jgi:hypothetical protein